jgi:hypothetical protein
MKKLLLALAILALATPALTADAYIALFADIDHSDCDVMLVGGFMPFDIYVFMISHLGVQAAEYKLIFPAYVIPQAPVKNPAVSVAMDDPVGTGGWSIAFELCQSGWTWSQRYPCYLTEATAGFVLVEAIPGLPLQVASCEAGYPKYPATVVNHLALNQSCEIATEESSWGAIKSLF